MIKISDFYKFLKYFIKVHNLALLSAIIVGVIYLAPYIIFTISLGDKYQGIPMLATANEDFYRARIQDIIDGHPLLGSFAFYESKNEPSLTPPTAEMFYALPNLLLGISLTKILIASRFILPFILFLLVYFLINKITVDSLLLSNKLNAIAGGLFVTLGYDLVDYHSLWLYLIGQAMPGGNFLIWARPVNPVMGAIFLFSFLICVWSIIQKSRYRRSLIITASVFLALMISSYFFSWGVAVSVLAVLILIYTIKKEFKVVKDFFGVGLLAALMASPYWYISFKASQGLWYKGALLRNGLFYTHYPMLNKFLITSLLFYFIIVVIAFIFRKERVRFKDSIKDWHLFTLALLLGGFWALNQQVVTGMTVWPYHFVQYTIPSAMVVLLALLYNIIKGWKPFLWALATSIIVSSSLIFSVVTQIGTYQINFNDTIKLQSYKPVFDWLNSQENDSVVLVKIDNKEKFEILNGLIPAFTHANIYASIWAYNLMVPDRIHHSFLTILRLRGVASENIEEYLQKNKGEAVEYLSSNFKGVFSLKDFPDFSDTILQERLKSFPAEYQKFASKNFKTELKKYRLDYIVSEGELNKKTKDLLPELQFIENLDNIYLYKF